jgi:hypothetical protein
MTVILLLPRNSCTNKAESTGALTWWRNQSPRFHFTGRFRHIFPHMFYSAEVVKVGLESTLVEHIHNAQLHKYSVKQ